jgi:hypothetical protein
MFCNTLDFRQSTTVIKSLNPTGPTIIVSAPSNGVQISSNFAQRPLVRLLRAAVAQTGLQASRVPDPLLVRVPGSKIPENPIPNL